MVTPQQYMTIYVLESVTAGHTGARLFDRVLWPLCRNPGGYRAVMSNSGTRKIFMECLQQIQLEAERDGVQPTIHIEAHGNEARDGRTDGIRLASDEVILWKDLGAAITPINIACGGRLILVLAACDSKHVVQISRPTERSPFWRAICSMRDVSAGEVEDCTVAYYETLIRTMDVRLALRKMNEAAKQELPEAFGMVTSEFIFKMAVDYFWEQHATAKGRQRWAESLLTRTRDMPGAKGKTLGERRAILKKYLAEAPMVSLRRNFEYHFMLDLYPENKDEFEPAWNACAPAKGQDGSHS
jgi:hypothetical protein